MAYLEFLTISNGQAASGATNTGNPVKIGGAYNSSPPTLASGQVGDAQVDVNGNLKTSIVNGISAGTAGTPSANVITVQGAASMTPVQVTIASGSVTLSVTPAQVTSGGASYYNIIAPATPAAVAVKASGGNIVGLRCVNTSAAAVYIKFWDVTSAPTIGTTAATWQIPVPGNTSGAGIVVPFPEGRSHAHSIYIAVTGGISYTDNTAITANSVVLDVSYN
jgi:hypothetical protein